MRVRLPILLLAVVLTDAGCRPTIVYEDESFFPRNLDVEVDPSGVHFLHVAGFADGSYRIYRVGDAALSLERVFWAGFGTDPTTNASTAALIDAPSVAGAWDVALVSDGSRAMTTGRLAHRAVRFVKDAGTWTLSSELQDGAPVDVDLPAQGGLTELLDVRVRGLDQPRGLALTADDRRAYVAGYGDGAVARLGIDRAELGYQGAITNIDAPRQLLALEKATTTTTATSSATMTSSVTVTSSQAVDFVYVLGGSTSDCSSYDDTQLLALRWEGVAEDTTTPPALLLQEIVASDAEYVCADIADETAKQECLRDGLEVPGLRGGFGLTQTVTSSGSEYLLVSSECFGTVTAFERRDDDLLEYAGSMRVVAPWEDAALVTTSSASAAGLRNLEVLDGVVYATATDGGFVAYFPIECVTDPTSLADTSVCQAVLCLDDLGGCAAEPTSDPTTVSAHPWGLRAVGALLYVTYDFEGQIAVLDIAADGLGTPTLRYVY